MKILIMAGGTAGHIFPALAVAKKLQLKNHKIYWLGKHDSIEEKLLANHNIPLYLIKVDALRGKNLFKKFLASIKLLWALLRTLFVMLHIRPHVVLGMGGYVSGPGGLAAYILRIKLVIHEQNAVAGMTNRILARFSHKIMEGFPQSFPYYVKTYFTGNPLYEKFHTIPKPNIRINKNNTKPLKILILGGSNGARAINNIIPKIIKIWGNNIPQPLILHQVGLKNIKHAKNTYEFYGFKVILNKFKNNIKLVDFIKDMPNAYAWADIVICRSGAITIAELSAIGVASILVPYPYATDNHQSKNAQCLLQIGAAIIFQQCDLKVQVLCENLQKLALDREKLIIMAMAAQKIAKSNALDAVVNSIA